MKISITIMAHPKRRKQAEALFVQLAQYPFAQRNITWDQHNEEWETGKRALSFGIGRGDWHVVIQDDAVLTPCFYQNIEGAIYAAMDIAGGRTLISLYTGKPRPFKRRVTEAIAKASDGDFLLSHQLFWGVGIVIPSSHIEPMLEFVEDIDLQYDNKIGEFYCQNAAAVLYTVPSLVDHDESLGSLIDGHGVSPEPRVAHRVAEGLIEWSDKSYYI